MYTYYLVKTDRHGKKAVIGVTNETEDEVYGVILLDESVPEDVGCRWSNRKSHISSRWEKMYDASLTMPGGPRDIARACVVKRGSSMEPLELGKPNPLPGRHRARQVVFLLYIGDDRLRAFSTKARMNAYINHIGADQEDVEHEVVEVDADYPGTPGATIT